MITIKLPNDYISVSQINMYLRCPAQYYFRYVEGLKLPPTSALTKGKAVHKGNEVNYKQKIETKQDMKLDDVLDIVSTEYEQMAVETEFRKGEDKGKIKDETISLAKVYHENIAPLVIPKAVECEVRIPMLGYDLLGYIDVIQDTGDGGVIRDTKTSAKTPSESVIQKSLQLSAYALAYREIYKEKEKGVMLDYLISTKIPKVMTLQAQRTDEEIQRFVKISDKVVQAIQNELFYPNQDNFMCTKDNCGYWELCHKKF